MKKLILLLSVLVFGFSVLSQDHSKMQSAYIYHFTKHMEWPSHKQSGDFVIAVIGNSAIYDHLVTMSHTKKVGARKIIVKKYENVSSVTSCHMIFLSSAKSTQLNLAITKAKTNHALIITEKTGYSRRGSGINFVSVGGKPQFEVSETSINKYGLKVSAKLVQLGIKV
jgi:hypothetical protein